MTRVEEFSVVGKRLPLKDARKKVTGQAWYASDMKMPGMLHIKILRSPHPHARISTMDISEAQRLPGVKAVLCKDNVPKTRVPISFGLPSDNFLFDEKVRFVGDAVAAVAAKDEETAKKALRLIKVGYEILPAVFDPLKAMEAGAPLVHEEKAGNLAGRIPMGFGDVNAGLKEADYVFEQTFRTPSQRHASMETHCAMASFDASGRLTVWASTQLPFVIRDLLAQYLQLPHADIRVVKPHVGGGFGAKLDMLVEHICALVSLRTGLPAKLVLDREEEFAATLSRSACVISLKVGVKKDGRLTAIEGKAIANTGAHLYKMGPLGVLGKGVIRSYRCPNASFESIAVYTNVMSAGAFRGYGSPEAHFAIESMMDIVSEKLEMDPVQFRKKNYTRTGDIGVMEQPVTSCGMEDCLERGARLIGWDRRKPVGRDSGKSLRGIGMAGMTHSSGARAHLADYSAAIVSFNEDGSVHLRTGSSDLGTGSDTTLSQIAAEELGVSPDAVRVISGDTDTTPMDRGAYSTRTLFVAGGAVQAASREAKRQLIAWAAGRLEAKPEDLETRNGQIFVKGSPTKGMPLSQITREASRVTKGAMSFIGSASFENPSCASGFGTHFVEVAIDPETGKVALLKVVAVMDVGRAINPAVVEGQIEGALQQGLGYALSENPVIDPKAGKMLNADFANYMVATALDMPEIEIDLVESVDPTGPFGAKGVGETCILGIAPAIANAIYNATGIRFFELPITAERIFMALRKKTIPER